MNGRTAGNEGIRKAIRRKLFFLNLNPFLLIVFLSNAGLDIFARDPGQDIRFSFPGALWGCIAFFNRSEMTYSGILNLKKLTFTT